MIKEEILKNLKSPKAIIVFLFLIVLVTMQSIDSVYYVKVIDFYHDADPAFISLLSNNNNVRFGTVFHYLMPIYLILSYCDKYNLERKKGITNIYLTKMSRKNFYCSKMASAFLNSIIIIGIPLVFNFVINIIFLHGGKGFFGMENWPVEWAGKYVYFCIRHSYITYIGYIISSLLIFGSLGIICQSLCIILKDNRLSYLVSFGVWYSFYCINTGNVDYATLPFEPDYTLKAAITSLICFILCTIVFFIFGYIASMGRKDEI